MARVADAPSSAEPRVGILIVAYNATSTLARVLDRIPTDVRRRVSEICVFDDASQDDTYLVGHGYKAVRDIPNLTIHRNPLNRGYGGNQKVGYRYLIDRGFDIVVLLHGDGQYAPEIMAHLLDPIVRGEADAILGSRMLERGGARRGRMPLYKLLGNRVLTAFENRVLGTSLSEFHSGYRAYNLRALARIPFERNTNDFHFDTEILVQLHESGFRIRETPIPTYYGDESCYVNGWRYAWNCARTVVEYRLALAGLRDDSRFSSLTPRYPFKSSPYSSHQRLLKRVRGGTRVLDVRCGDGHLGAVLRERGCTVVGLDARASEEARRRLSRVVEADLEGDRLVLDEEPFDYVLMADVLEHVREPERLLRWAAGLLRPGGHILASTGNVALWFVRLSLLTGRFNYGPRGILDRTHVRLYTRATFRSLIEACGLRVLDEDVTTIPVGQLLPGFDSSKIGFWVDTIGYQAARSWPEACAYQIVIEAEPNPSPLT